MDKRRHRAMDKSAKAENISVRYIIQMHREIEKERRRLGEVEIEKKRQKDRKTDRGKDRNRGEERE